MSDPISVSLRALQRIGADGFGGTALAADVGPTVRRVARRRVGRAVGAGVAAVALVAAVTVGAIGYSGRTASPAHPSPAPSSHPSAERVLVVVDHTVDATNIIAGALWNAGVTDSPQDFVREAEKHPGDLSRITPGDHWLPPDIGAADALAAMLDPSTLHGPNITFDPGLTKEQMFKQIEVSLGIRTADLYLASKDPSSFGLPAEANGDPEGWLWPYGYYFAPGTTATEALAAMVQATVAHLDDLGVEPSDRQHVLTVASLVDRVAPFDSERRKVARVIENRVAAGIPLAYNQGFEIRFNSDGTYFPKLDAQGNSPGDTFPYPGLPRAPLGAPSTSSLAAAAHPADGPWLYFVAFYFEHTETRYETTLEDYLKDFRESVVQMQQSQSEAWPERGTLVWPPPDSES